jgi:hypothetical protein
MEEARSVGRMQEAYKRLRRSRRVGNRSGRLAVTHLTGDGKTTRCGLTIDSGWRLRDRKPGFPAAPCARCYARTERSDRA